MRTCIPVARKDSLVLLAEEYKAIREILEILFECLHFRLELWNRKLESADNMNQLILPSCLLVDALDR